MANTETGGQLKKTAAHSAIYAIGTAISRISGLVMLPIYTRYLNPADYGTITLLTMALEITRILVGMRISQAMFRFYILSTDQKEKKEIISTVLLTAILGTSVGTAVLYLAAKPLCIIIFGSSSYQYEFQVFAFTLITSSIVIVGQAFIRARQMPIFYVSIGVIILVIQIVFNIVFVIALDMHVRGVVYASIGSGIIFAIGFFLYMATKVGLVYSFSIARRLIKFIAPLILASIGAFYVSYADKYFLRLFNSLTEVGLYVLAMKITSIIGTIFESFNMTWSADRFEIVKQENAKSMFQQVFRFLSGALILAGVGVGMFSSDLLHIMSSKEFYPAANLTPFLMMAVIIRVYSIYCNFGIMLNESTQHIAQATWIKVIVSTIAYISLIPFLGTYGAAIALLLSNLSELYWVNRMSTREYDMGLNWKPVSAMFIVGIIFMIGSFLIPVGGVMWLFSRMGLYILFTLIIYKLPVWKVDDRIIMNAGIKKIVAYLPAYK